MKRLVAIITVFAVIIAAAIGVSWASLSSGDKPKSTPTEEVEETWIHYYNLDLQDDGDEDNDFNFGPNSYEKGEAKDAEYYDKEFRERLKWDPALAAAATAWLDVKVGTRYLGEFYESCKGDWAKTMNEAKLRFASDQTAFYEDLDAFFAFLNTAKKVEIREIKKGVSDQMYMNPYTKDGVPDIIVLKTKGQTGHELVYTFEIKGNTFLVAYRIECGFQPTNVAKIMNITPVNKPSKPSNPTTPSTTTPKPTEPKPTEPSTTEPTKPDPTKPDPTTTPYNKDPSKAPSKNTEDNDDPGPGPDTNNPANPNKSTKDKPSNSTNYDSYDDYRQEMDEKAKVNETQKVGGDSNTPSVTPSKPAKVDNNADKGTGNGGIDTPTPTKEPAKEADSGKPIDSNPGTAWGGPPD